MYCFFFFFSSRRRHTRCSRDWSSDVCSSDLAEQGGARWSSEARSRLGLYAHVPGVGGFAHHVLAVRLAAGGPGGETDGQRSEEHTAEPQSPLHLLCRPFV